MSIDTKAVIPMYRGIHHDVKNNMVFMWHTDGTRVAKSVAHQFYTPNRGELGSMPCGKKDIYGNDVYIVPGMTQKKEYDTKSKFAGPHNYLSEIDIDFRTRFLENYYSKAEEPRFKMDDFNVCFLDIEVESGDRFPTAKVAAERVNCVTIYLSKEKKYYVYGLEKEIRPETYEKLKEVNAEYICCPTEKHLLTWLFTKIGKSDVDIISGWNCISKDSRVWLEDRITKIGNVKHNDKLFKHGLAKVDSVLTGRKEAAEITLANGSKLRSSLDHRFPYAKKDHTLHVNHKTLYPTFDYNGATVSNLKEYMVDNDVYLKYELGKYKDTPLTYKKLILDNLDTYLTYDSFDIIIDDQVLHERMEANNKPLPKRWSTKSRRISDVYKCFTYKNNSDIYSIDELIDYINRNEYIYICTSKIVKIKVNIDSIINNDLLYILGMWYTDGTYDRKRNVSAIYNTNDDILNACSDILASNCDTGRSIFKCNDGCSTIKFTKIKSELSLLYPLIYGNNNNTKNISIELMSQLSSDQFSVFMGGAVDGDGTIHNGAISLCNYNNDDIYKLQELCAWSGFITTVHSNTLRISKLELNRKLIVNVQAVLKHNTKANKVSFNLTEIKDTKSKQNAYMYNSDMSEVLVKIKSIEACESELMYDISTDSSLFNANGILTHNCDYFDNPFLIRRAEILGINPKALSRLPTQHQSAYEDKRTRMLKIGGTETLDYYKLYKSFSRGERDDYKLDTIGKFEVNDEKAPLPDGYQSYKNYWDDYVWYNIKDVELLVKIDAKKRFVETTIGACSEANVPFGAIFESKKMLVGFLLKFLHKKGLVMPPLKEHESRTFPGAYVYSTPGYYQHLVSYDYRSMYPSIMMGANVSPETKVTFPIEHVFTAEEEEYVKTLVKSPWDAWGTKKIYYRKDIDGIVPEVVKILFDGRTELKNLMKKAKKEGRIADVEYYDMKQQAYKLFGNSLYGLLGNSHFQLYDLDNSATITAYGVDLITGTIVDLVKYMETDFVDDPRYEKVFGAKPVLNKELFGSYINDTGQKVYNRISHGDTDSFFVKYEDIYKSFGENVDKHIEVLVFNGSELVSKSRFDLPDGELASKQQFNKMCHEYIEEWTDMPNDRKKSVFVDGLIIDGDYRVIYNKFGLTDYSRIIDAALMEDKLDEIMQKYQAKWNYMHDTIFLKREKCIIQAIVVAKKKYICLTESNEDSRYYEKDTLIPKLDYAVTGMEIIRSSTTPFSRKNIQGIIDVMLDGMDKNRTREAYLEVKKLFFDVVRSENAYDICIPSGVGSDPPDYNYWSQLTPEQKKIDRLDWRVKCGMIWNHLIETDPVLSKEFYEPIHESSKAKFINITNNNEYGANKVAFTGRHVPPRLIELFNVDWESQWETTYGSAMGKLFSSVGWSSDLENDERDTMMELF